jgi:predicted transglutaminase-like cysteine proteinase
MNLERYLLVVLLSASPAIPAMSQPAVEKVASTSGPADEKSRQAASFNAAIAQAYIETGAPNVFGSTALRVARTPLDWRWKKVAAATPFETAVWADITRALQDRAGAERLAAVNGWVNENVRFKDDSRHHAGGDHWSEAGETLRSGLGDCEDYAIVKMQILRATGVPASDLFLVITRDLVRRADHAVLLVRLGGSFFVLDNGTDKVLDAAVVRDYRPIYSFSGDRIWVHGYRKTTKFAAVGGVARSSSGPTGHSAY